MWTVILLLALQAAPKPALPAAEANRLRASFAEALVDGAKAKKLVAEAERLEGRYSGESLLEALRAGPRLPAGEPKPRGTGRRKEKLEHIGDVIVGFTFESGGETYGYLVSLPKGYDAQSPAPLVLDPGHGSGAGKSLREKADFVPYFRGAADRSGLESALVVRSEIIEEIGADGRRGAKPEETVAAVFDDLFVDLASRFAIDPDRVYAAGISQTGFWSWYLGRARADRFAGIAPIAAVTWHVDPYLDCYANLPVYVVHGEKDPICKVEMPRRTSELLRQAGFPVTYVELPGAEHGGPVFGRLGEALGFLAQTARDPWPKRVRRALLTTQNPHAYWLRVTKLEREGDGRAQTPPVANLDARVEGQTITIESRGIAELELSLAAELLDLDAPIEVVWNERSVHSGPVESSFARALEQALAKADWRGTGPARLALRKPKGTP